MFVSLLLLCVFATTVVDAFTTSGRVFTSRSSLSMTKETSDVFSSKNAVKFATGLLAAASLSISSPSYAATYGGFGKGSPEVLDPKSAVMNEDTFKSDDVKAGIAGLNELTDTVASLKTTLAADGQSDVTSTFKTGLARGKIRNVLNKYNMAFSEDTQRGTDRLIRSVIQDVTELDRELQVKPGKTRSPVKVEAVVKRLTAAENSLKDLAAFYPK